jgi:transposase
MVVERSFGWMSRFRRPARGHERLPETLAGLHYVAFVILMLKNVVEILT